MLTLPYRLYFKTALLVSLSVCISPCFTQSYDQPGTYQAHLTQVNQEWENYKNECPQQTVLFDSEADRIQAHLFLVIDYLRANSPFNLPPEKTKNRLILLDRLWQYASAKVFPINKYHLHRQPYFVDESGTNCAVGEMIASYGIIKEINKDEYFNSRLLSKEKFELKKGHWSIVEKN